MIELVPVEATSLKPERRPCVIDPRLATSEWGATTVARMSALFELWISAYARQIIRSPGEHQAPSQPDTLVPRTFPWSERPVDRLREARVTREELEHWRRAASSSELAHLRLHYLGDRPDESITPRFVDPHLHQRYLRFHQTLAEQVERAEPAQANLSGSHLRLLHGEQRVESDWPLRDCYQETLALAAALSPSAPFILSRLEGEEAGAPALCEYACSWKLTVRKVPRRGGRFARALRESLARAELAPVLWSGIRLAGIYVAFAHPLPEPGHAAAMDKSVPSLNHWPTARVFWHEI